MVNVEMRVSKKGNLKKVGGEMNAVPEKQFELAGNDESSASARDISPGKLARILDPTYD